MKFWKLTSAAIALVLLSTNVNAATIVDTASLATTSFYTLGDTIDQEKDPLGQSFVLDQSYENLMIGGLLQDVNPSLSPAFEITISLVSGAGTSGPLLGSQTVTLSDGFSDLYIEDFSFIGALSAGTYSVLFSSNNTGRGALGFIADNPYELGAAYNEAGIFEPSDTLGDLLGLNNNLDAAILVTGDVSAVPLPAAIWLFSSGLLGLVGLARKNKV